MAKSNNRYSAIIEDIFRKNYRKDDTDVSFEREDLVRSANKLGIALPKNLGDIIYSFRYRAMLPESITRIAPEGLEWVIRPTGQSKYKFSLTTLSRISPNTLLVETKIPDATPGLIEKYAFNDEQSLLAKLRYNRLIDIFTGITCYSLQNHLRTTVPEIGQVETDEIYVGIDKHGAQYVIPVQAKGGSDKLGIVQIEQDFALCSAKFPMLVCRPVAAQIMEDNLLALFSFEMDEKGVSISREKHYRLVLSEQTTEEDVVNYRKRVL
ncbi:endonuclease [Chlorobaculum sp. 24CR]|uniref:endonuclease n=1 Tax=Chlorobaculum sp. 24CR TaxID=2508878 RepID=UPI00100B6EF2|nr:endonuclease [Chlorobaculum sp. 24CR]RXK87780.1 endonuclease [Chlorobaculum sp. 24CR]